MKKTILCSHMPSSGWWGKGMPVYENNWSMQEGLVPDNIIARQEHDNVLGKIKRHATVELIDFPESLDTQNLYRHDAVFVRDAFISNQKGDIVVSNFKEKQRQAETVRIKEYLGNKGYNILSLSDDAYSEGGEYYYAPHEDVLFAGLTRNNSKGVSETGKLLGISTIFTIYTKAYHLDTLFAILLDKKGDLTGVLACLDLIHNKLELKFFLQNQRIPLIALNTYDTIDYDGKGSIAVNCLAVPGILINGGVFTTPGVEEAIASYGIDHVHSPVTQFLYSGGGVHCLTNELS